MSYPATVIAALAQALLTAYVAVVLLKGARTAARKTLGRALVWMSLYAVLMAVAQDLSTPFLNLLLLWVAVWSTLEVTAYAHWLSRGAKRDEAPRLPFAAREVTLVALGALVVHVALAPNPSLYRAAYQTTLLVVLLALFLASIALCISAARRGVRGARSILVACAFPVGSTIFNVVGMWRPVPITAYNLVRDFSILGYALALLVAYLDRGHEPMSLGSRVVAAALTTMLAVMTAAGHLLVPVTLGHAPAHLAGEAAAELVRIFVLLLILGTIAAVALLPLLLRRSVLAPLAHLTQGLARAERGELVELRVDHEDEIGRVTRSFNQMVAALAEGRARLEEQVRALDAQRREVEALNEELHRQVAARSRELSELLSKVDVGAGALEVGDVVDGRYRIDDRLGRGGMGVVYAVTRLTDDRALALKVMATQTSREDGVRFAREAEIAARLDHRNLVSVTDVGLYRGMVFFVMERVFGGSLDESRERFGDLAWALPVLGQIAEGLAALHDRGIVHRDLKPGNVLLEAKEGRTIVKISDFGIARQGAVDALAATASVAATASSLLDETQPASNATSGALLGTLAYMAPELARRGAIAAPSADVFALGILAYELLGAGYPFRVPPFVDALSGREAPAPPALAGAVPEGIAVVVRACLATVEARPSARAVAAAVAARTA